jgi:peptidylprolyl isomerase
MMAITHKRKQSMSKTDKVKIEELSAGAGNPAQSGDFIRVHYTGQLSNGTVFDSSGDRDPLEFQLGSGEVIQGWDLGLVGLQVGGKRKLTIPPALGYGERDMGDIPPHSTLIFEVELVQILSF